MASELLSLYQIVEHYRLQSFQPESAFNRLYQLAVRGFKKLEMVCSGVKKTEELEVSAAKIAYLPDGLLTLLSVYKLTDNGEKIEIPKNNNLSNHNSTSEERTTGKSSCDDSWSYSVDVENSRIVFPYNFSETVVYADFISMYEDVCDDIMVAPEIEEALIAWLRWQDNLDKAGRLQTANHRGEFYNELRVAKRMLNRFNIKDILSWQRNKKTAYRYGREDY